MSLFSAVANTIARKRVAHETAASLRNLSRPAQTVMADAWLAAHPDLLTHSRSHLIVG